MIRNTRTETSGRAVRREDHKVRKVILGCDFYLVRCPLAFRHRPKAGVLVCLAKKLWGDPGQVAFWGLHSGDMPCAWERVVVDGGWWVGGGLKLGSERTAIERATARPEPKLKGRAVRRDVRTRDASAVWLVHARSS
jgi:hypothetical protein